MSYRQTRKKSPQNHPAKTVREIKGQDLWQQEKLSCTSGRNAFIRKTNFRSTKACHMAKQLLPKAMEGNFKFTF